MIIRRGLLYLLFSLYAIGLTYGLIKNFSFTALIFYLVFIGIGGWAVLRIFGQ